MKTTDSYVFGDIVAAHVPFSDGSQTKIRPVLILSKDKDDYLMLRITSNVSSKETYDVGLTPDTTNNIRGESVIKIKKIGNFSREILSQKIGVLSHKDCQLVKNNLKEFVDNL